MAQIALKLACTDVQIIEPELYNRQNQELQNIIDDINSEHGDLTKRLTVKSQDEIGQMAQGVNQFIETLQKIIGNMSENARLDKDNQVVPLTDEQINPVWKLLNYETGKYESVQKHFRIFEV